MNVLIIWRIFESQNTSEDGVIDEFLLLLAHQLFSPILICRLGVDGVSPENLFESRLDVILAAYD